MAFQFVQGRTVNWLHWVGVDSVDFATRESALSAAWKFKIHGFLESTSLVYFVSSGTGSAAGGDIKHVGASVFGTYALPLAKADLSDASAAWYDTYVVNLSATGAAIETFICEGVRTDTSYLSNVLSHVSAVVSDIYSALTVAQSRILLIQSDASNANSILVAGATLTSDAMSDVAVAVWANATGTRVDSRVLKVLSDTSDTLSKVLIMSGILSDTYSMLVAHSDILSDIVAMTTGNSNILSQVLVDVAGLNGADASDIASAVWAHAVGTQIDSRLRLVQSDASNANSILVVGLTLSSDAMSDIAVEVWTHATGARVDSRLRLVQSDTSDTLSKLIVMSDIQSDILSTLGSQFAVISNYLSNTSAILSDTYSGVSDLRSLLTTTGTLLTSDAMSDIAVAVWANTTGVQVNSRLLVNQSAVSTLSAVLSDFYSDFQSRVPKLVATDSRVASDLSTLLAAIAGVTATLSSDAMSDIAVEVWNHATGVQVNSRLLVNQSAVSTLSAILSDFYSDFQSRVPKLVATSSQVSDLSSDLKSAITGITATLSSDAMSDIAVEVWGHATGVRVDSRLLKVLSDTSDTLSKVIIMSGILSDTYSMLAANSDILSQILGDTTGLAGADASDIASAVWGHATGVRIDSQLLVNQSAVSNLSAILSDFYSDFQSRVPKLVATNSQVSDLSSDLKSAIAAVTVTLSSDAMSDIAVEVWTHATGARVDSRLRLVQSDTSNANSILVVGLTLSSDAMSDIAVEVWNHATGVRVDSRLLKVLSDTSDTLSKVIIMSGILSDTYSAVSDLNSDLRSLLTTTGTLLSSDAMSDIAVAVWANATGIQVNSRLLVNQSAVSTLSAVLSDFYSDFQSRVPKLVATSSQVSDLSSDLKSALAGVTATLSSDAMSDIAVEVWTHATGTRVDSRLLKVLSDTSDTLSKVIVMSGVVSDVYSMLAAHSDVLSQILADTTGLAGVDASDIASAVWGHAVGTQVNSRLLVNQSSVNDIYGLLSDTRSTMESQFVVISNYLSNLSALSSDIFSGVVALSDMASNAYSAAAVGASRTLLVQSRLSALDSRLVSNVSDILSAVAAVTATLSASDISDLASAVWTNAIGARVDSRLRLVQSDASNIYSLLSSLENDLQSRFPATIPELTTDPGATPTWARATMLQYMWLKNPSKSTPTKRMLRNDAGTTVLSGVLEEDSTSVIIGRLG